MSNHSLHCSEALALVIHESKVKMPEIGKKQQKQKAANTAGSSQAQHRSQGQSSSKTVIPLDLDGKMSHMPSSIENRGCEQPPVSTTGNISQSLALVPVKKTAPTRKLLIGKAHTSYKLHFYRFDWHRNSG